MPNVITCPQCAMQLRVPDTMAPGTSVKCPKCASTFAVPAAGAATPPPPPAGQFAAPQHANVGGGPGPNFGEMPRDPVVQRRGAEGLSNNYQTDMGTDFGAGMQHYSPTLGPMVGFGFILWGIIVVLQCMGIIPYIGSCFQLLVNVFVMFALYAGYVVVCLRQIRGQSWQFGDFFGGFNYYGSLFVNQLLMMFVGLLCFLPAIICLVATIVIAGVNQPGQPTPFPPPGGRPAPPQQLDTTAIVGLVVSGLLALGGIIPLLYFQARYFLFVPWLVIDRNVGVMEAIQGNKALTEGHAWAWVGLMVVLGLINFVGAIPCALGVPFTNQIYYLVLTSAYLRITGGETATGPV